MRLLEMAGIKEPHLPVLIFPDGVALQEPTNTLVAEKIGLKTRAQSKFYDFIVVGSGPAGLAAGVYGGSEGLRTLIIERHAPGGQAGTSSHIDNYLGFPIGLTGADLTRRAVAQAERFGVEVLTPVEVVGVKLQDSYRILTLSDGSEVSCHALLMATGVSYRKLDVPGIDALTGAGVYYGAALTEALSMRGEDVYIVGGANSAGEAAVSLARHARSVTMLVRSESLTAGMSTYLIELIGATPNIKVLSFSAVIAVKGDTHLEQITVKNINTGESQIANAAALFIFIGAQPRTEWIADVVERDTAGFVLTGTDLIHDGAKPKGWNLQRLPYMLESSVPGIFVAGDVRHMSIKRIATAVGEGAMTVAFVHQYLANL